VTLKIEADEGIYGLGDTHHADETDAVFPHAYAFSDRSLRPGQAPGAYPPGNRLEGGSMFNW
jgi:mannonate dehydratase